MRHPERITAVISQNGDAYEEGLSEGSTLLNHSIVICIDPSPFVSLDFSMRIHRHRSIGL